MKAQITSNIKVGTRTKKNGIENQTFCRSTWRNLGFVILGPVSIARGEGTVTDLSGLGSHWVEEGSLRSALKAMHCPQGGGPIHINFAANLRSQVVLRAAELGDGYAFFFLVAETLAVSLQKQRPRKPDPEVKIQSPATPDHTCFSCFQVLAPGDPLGEWWGEQDFPQYHFTCSERDMGYLVWGTLAAVLRAREGTERRSFGEYVGPEYVYTCKSQSFESRG